MYLCSVNGKLQCLLVFGMMIFHLFLLELDCPERLRRDVNVFVIVTLTGFSSFYRLQFGFFESDILFSF